MLVLHAKEKRRIRRRRQISCAHFNLKAERGGVIGQKREKEKEKSALGKEGVGSSVLHRTRWTPAVLKRSSLVVFQRTRS